MVRSTDLGDPSLEKHLTGWTGFSFNLNVNNNNSKQNTIRTRSLFTISNVSIHLSGNSIIHDMR